MGLARKNDFDKDFVMKCCLVLCDLPVKYGVQNFTSENLAMIEARWPGIQSAIKRAVELANRFGIDRETLTSANALVPIVYWFYQRPKLKLMEGTPYSARNGSLVRSWLVMALLSNVFSGSSDTMLQAIREELKKHGDPDADFPMNELIAVGERLNKPLLNLESGIGNILDIEYAEKRAFLALSLLYEDANWGTNALHKDHIFPQSMFKAKAMDAAGLPREKQEEFGATYNRLGNLELLLDTDNTQKNDQDFAKWIQTRDSDFKKRHFIPDDPNLWNLASFGKFLERREELITARLRSIIHISKGAPRCL